MSETFFFEVSHSIREIHEKYALAHMDICLDNICFNREFRPVFIDFDRSDRTHCPIFVHIDSCMIDMHKTTDENDWMQFGWMIIWILQPSANYHNRVFEDLPNSLKENETLQLLIQEGRLSCSAENDEIFYDYQDTIASVLRDRTCV